MEFFSGHITLREIFLLYWESYLLWRQDEVREKIIKQKVSIHPVLKTWRERAKDRDKSDPLICEECNIEMVLYFVCFIYNEYMTRKLGLKYNEVIPSQQFKINTS